MHVSSSANTIRDFLQDRVGRMRQRQGCVADASTVGKQQLRPDQRTVQLEKGWSFSCQRLNPYMHMHMHSSKRELASRMCLQRD